MFSSKSSLVSDDELPSVSMSLDTIGKDDSDLSKLSDTSVDDDESDGSSDLTEAPSSFVDIMEEAMDIDSDDHVMLSPEARSSSSPQSPKKRKASPSLLEVSSGSVNNFGDLAFADNLSSPSKYRVVEVSPFEGAPKEVVQRIASDVETDGDLYSLSLTCRTFAAILIPENSEVWRNRFLARYDHPIITGPFEYCVAYRLRRFVLRTITGFGHGGDKGTLDEKAKIQLKVLRDMVLETYHKRKPNHPKITHSRNLAAFSSPDNSPWMQLFLKSPLYAQISKKGYGEPHSLFDTLHVLLSHLLLSFASPMIHFVNSDRSDFNLARVYNWNQQFSVLYTKLPYEEVPPEWRSSLFPNLRSPSPTSKTTYALDMHSILHIRNFWYHHMLNDLPAQNEHTYVRMAKKLMAKGSKPKKWDTPLQEPGLLSEKWIGHYSCLHPWPKNEKSLIEAQTCAHGWTEVDPLTLDFTTSTDNHASGFWPAIFASLPAFSSTIPTVDHFDKVSDPETGVPVAHHAPYKYIRGLAPFLYIDESTAKGTSKRKQKTKPKPKRAKRKGKREAKNKMVYENWSDSNANSADEASALSLSDTGSPQQPPSTHRTTKQPQKNHPYLALRLRGIIHPIPASETASVPGFQRVITILYRPTTRYLIQVLEHAAEDYGNPFMQLLPTGAPALETETALKTILREKMHEFEAEFDRVNGKSAHGQEDVWTRPTIARLEDAFIPPAHLDWADIEYAYAYEGTVVAGGKIMLGRWWRCASVAGGGIGEGGGAEVVEVLQGQTDEAGDPVPGFGRERGPFVFWC